jgi:hypothetical protein
VTYTFKNTGTTTWSSAGAYLVITQDPANNSIWGFNHLAMPGTVAPGATVVISAPCKAPATPGTYGMQIQLAKNGLPFGEKSGIVNVTVLATPPPP